MPEVFARRTLMKSAPELWAQVANSEGLASRLPGVEGIRIVRTERQRHIAWEGEQASGEIMLEPAGFGTKVTLTVAREESPEAAGGPPEAAGGPPEAAGGPPEAGHPPNSDVAAVGVVEVGTVDAAATAAPAPDTLDTMRAPAGQPDPEPLAPHPDRPVEPDHWADATSAPAPARRGFFARLFRSAPASAADDAPTSGLDLMPEQPTEIFEALGAEETEPQAHDSSAPPFLPGAAPATASVNRDASDDEARPPSNASTLPVGEQPVASQARADAPNVDAELLEAALDSLGTNHHRPFSRG